jgi:hypothetical protein
MSVLPPSASPMPGPDCRPIGLGARLPAIGARR